MSPLTAFAQLPTEQRHPRGLELDRLTISQILRAMNREDATVARAVRRAMPHVAKAAARITAALRGGGRLFFVGAGTSGRLGVIEAAECPPTFSTPPRLVQAIIAGGRSAVFRSREGAEDDRRAGGLAIRRKVRAGDAVVGIAASGVTPFVAAALRTARQLGASTVLVTCHPTSTLAGTVDVAIALPTGPEILTGSTRLKAGTATKFVLNMLTVATMVSLGKVYGNLMVDVRPTSRKLRARAVRILQTVAGIPQPHATRLLQRAGGRVKVAIIMALRDTDPAEAKRLLARHRGQLRPILEPR